MFIKYIIENTDCEFTLNDLLKNKFNISARLLFKLIKNGRIFINNEIFNTRLKCNSGDELLIDFSAEEDNSNIVPTKMDLSIVYEDDWMLVVNKPANMPVHPSMEHFTDSLANGIRFYFDSIGLKKKIRIVNRLDLNTSGLVIVAKCEYIQECLIKEMSDGSFKKSYLALASGIFNKKDDVLTFPIARKQSSIIERCVDFENGQFSSTHYRVIKEIDGNSLILCSLKTGRTHQIRVHLSYIGHPLVGDSLYGNCSASEFPDGQKLHCYRLKFVHPITNNLIILKSKFGDRKF